MGNPMKFQLRIACFLCLLSPLGVAESWRGLLVDSKCYESAARNVSPWEPYHDEALDARLCRPTSGTKVFAILQDDWTRLKLDSAANPKAAEVVRSADKKRPYLGVVVTGEKDKDTVKVETIAAARSQP
jgi:hypothetical protein